METYYTSDRVEITQGLKVLTNELKWGVVDRHRFDGWFTVRYENGSEVLMNGERLRTTPLPSYRNW